MATVEHTASGTFSKIPLGRRIAELMHERGDAFSIRAFSERLGINRETFRLTLLGERPITLTLLENITKGLHVSEERLRQLDTFKSEEELLALLNSPRKTKEKMSHAQTLARELVDVAIGYTERCMAWANLGRAQYYLQDYDLAHGSFLTAMEYAEKVNGMYGDGTLLYHVTSYLMVSYTIRKEYTNIEHTLKVVEDAFASDHEKMGYVHYTRMKWNEHRGNLEQAMNHAYIALDSFRKTNNKIQHSKALINVSHFEYLFENYQESATVLHEAIGMLQGNDSILIIAVKEYAKSLLQLEATSEVVRIIDKYATLARAYPDYWAKLQIMYTTATEDPSFAEAIVNDQTINESVRYLACKCLMELYYLKRDVVSSMRYYEMGRTILNTRSEYLNEGGF